MEAMHDCNVHMNDNFQAELGTMYIEIPEGIAMAKAMPGEPEWDLQDSMYIRVRSFMGAERAVASGVPQAPAARSGVG
jgi:hypothetical protein